MPRESRVAYVNRVIERARYTPSYRGYADRIAEMKAIRLVGAIELARLLESALDFRAEMDEDIDAFTQEFETTFAEFAAA